MYKLGIVLIGAAVAMSGCKSGGSALASATGPDSAEKFLRWSMDQHKALRSYHAVLGLAARQGDNTVPADDPRSPQTAVDFVAPNKFHIHSGQRGSGQTTISDGSREIVYMDPSGALASSLPPQVSVAPASIASAMIGGSTSMFGTFPMSPMFAGQSAYDVLVDTSKGKPTFGASESRPDGEGAREVKFYSTGYYGHSTVLIGERTGMVYRWTFDLEPLAAAQRQPGGTLPHIEITMKASEVKTNPVIDGAEFDTRRAPVAKTPEVAAETPPSNQPAEPPPLKEGSVAPEFAVKTLDGQTVSLASLKGKPVMIDFWATWCGPCKETLPETDKISLKYKNLTVLAVSDEDKSTVEKFVNQNHYKFRACLDAGQAMHRAYNVSGIPCFVFIDASGKVVKTIVGSGQSGGVDAALKMIGAS
jgi:thiol-disulfide isomerase/thioredoxin